MARLEDVWESHPKGGWSEFREALRAQQDRMRVESELHNVVVDTHAAIDRERRRDPGMTPADDDA